jgi:hypothetical protein
MTMPTHVQINVYRNDGQWFAASWVERKCQRGPLSVRADATSTEAWDAAHAAGLAIVQLRSDICSLQVELCIPTARGELDAERAAGRWVAS